MCCYKCKKPYEDFPFDLVVNDSVWEEITKDRPLLHKEGILCAECMFDKMSYLPEVTHVMAMPMTKTSQFSIEKIVRSSLLDCIKAHGNINEKNLSSAAKRILGQIKNIVIFSRQKRKPRIREE